VRLVREGAGGENVRMASAAGHQQPVPPNCWCCGNLFEESGLIYLGANPDVAVCAGCAHWLHRRARAGAELERRTPGARIRRVVDAARWSVMSAGAPDWPVIGPLLRRLDRHLP